MTFEFSGGLLRYVDYRPQVRVGGTSLGGALEALFTDYPKLKTVLLAGGAGLSQAHQIFLNGKRLTRDEQSDSSFLHKPVGETDTVSILTLITGG